jgi:hypothetical protein
MSNAENLPALPNNDDDFEFCPLAHEQVIHGDIFSCVDGNWRDGEGNAIPRDKPFICLGTAEVVQHFEDGMPVKDDTYVRTPTDPLPDINARNAEIPQDQWDIGINGEPRPPWSHSYAAYLLDPMDASIHTYINNTGGAHAGIRLLNDRVKWMRALRGARVFPIATLGSRLHSKKFNKLGPSFIIGGWRELGGGRPSEGGPKQLGAQHPVKQIGKSINEPTLAEILDDDLPDELKK